MKCFFVITIHNLISFISQKNTANIKGLRENSEYLLKNSNQELVSIYGTRELQKSAWIR